MRAAAAGEAHREREIVMARRHDTSFPACSRACRTIAALRARVGDARRRRVAVVAEPSSPWHERRVLRGMHERHLAAHARARRCPRPHSWRVGHRVRQADVPAAMSARPLVRGRQASNRASSTPGSVRSPADGRRSCACSGSNDRARSASPPTHADSLARSAVREQPVSARCTLGSICASRTRSATRSLHASSAACRSVRPGHAVHVLL